MTKTIKSLLLSAGLGTRLRPLTYKIPKCLVEINKKPLLEDWIDKLENINTESVLINTHYLADKVLAFLETQRNRKIKIHNFHEEKLLGTAGTLIANYQFFQNSTGIMIHADNFSTFNLFDLIKAHNERPKSCLLTMLTFKTQNPQSCGILEINKQKIVNGFHEKIKNPPGNIANGAIYVFENDFLDWLLENHPNAKDFSNEVLPNLLGKIYTFHTNSPYIDIGTEESLNEAISINN